MMTAERITAALRWLVGQARFGPDLVADSFNQLRWRTVNRSQEIHLEKFYLNSSLLAEVAKGWGRPRPLGDAT
jgi:hypothetical protein